MRDVSIASDPTGRLLSPAPRRLVAVGPAHARIVAREGLLRRLRGAAAARLVLLVAPAGYGKTTLLTQWSAADRRTFGWIRLDEAHGDADRLAADIGAALDGLLGADPFVLVLDDVHRLHGPEAMRVLARTIERLPAGAQVALASRSQPALPIGRLRAQGALLDLRADALAMTRREGAAMLHAAGVELAVEDAVALVRRTEGWPAGLALAASSLAGKPDPGGASAGFGGDDRFVAEFLRDELLAGLPPGKLAFLRRTSILDTLSGPACDAVLRSTGSGGLLRDLARSELMIVPLDRTDDAYRYHLLLAQALRAELRRTEPETEAALHRRASAWFARRGDADAAIEHAIAADDARLAGRLLWRSAASYATAGRHKALRRWLERFTPEDTEREPALALTAATLHLAMGDRDRLEHWARVAARRPWGADAPAGATPPEAALAIMRAASTRDGLARMRAEAVRGAELGAEGPWLAMSHLLRGVAAHLLGAGEAARPQLEEAARRGAIAAPLVQILSLAQLALLEFGAGDPEGAALLASRARAQVDRTGLGDCPAACLVFCVSAFMRAHRSLAEEAQGDRRLAAGLLAGPTGFAPWYAVEAHVVLARAASRLGDVPDARAKLAEAERVARGARDAVAALTWIEDARRRIDAYTITSAAGSVPLTTAELRVLGLLPTHLSFREMGERLQVSPNTIKTHVHSVYRKLDVCSRSDAVVRAGAVGLLGD